jgi:hypothetical protein
LSAGESFAQLKENYAVILSHVLLIVNGGFQAGFCFEYFRASTAPI